MRRTVDLFEDYKPLRNRLRKVDLVESLEVIRAYMQYLQFKIPFPADVEVHPVVLQATTPGRTVYEWQLDVLTREVLINSRDLGPADPTATLQRWQFFAQTLNMLKAFEDRIAATYPAGSGLLEVHRIAHRQFPWQRRPSMIWLSRYFNIFSSPAIDCIVQRRMDLTTTELYLIGLAAVGVFQDRFATADPPEIAISGLTAEKLHRFLAHFSRPLSDMQQLAASSRELDQNFAYAMNPLRSHPIIRIRLRARSMLIAPIPTFLFWRFTEGVYYELISDVNFPDAYGRSVQKYLGEVARRGTAGSSVKVYAEAEYRISRDRKDSVDWILEDPSAVLFVECKAKRLKLVARTEIRSATVLDEELDKLAAFVVQLYKTIEDCRRGYYPHFAWPSDRPLFPLVVTLEEWFVFGPRIVRELESRVSKQLVATGLNAELAIHMPYSICSVAEFETLVQLIRTRGINAVMESKTGDPELRQWLLGAVLSQQFPAEFRNATDLFPETLNQLMEGRMLSSQ